MYLMHSLNNKFASINAHIKHILTLFWESAIGMKQELTFVQKYSKLP